MSKKVFPNSSFLRLGNIGKPLACGCYFYSSNSTQQELQNLNDKKMLVVYVTSRKRVYSMKRKLGKQKDMLSSSSCFFIICVLGPLVKKHLPNSIISIHLSLAIYVTFIGVSTQRNSKFKNLATSLRGVFSMLRPTSRLVLFMRYTNHPREPGDDIRKHGKCNEYSKPY